MESYLLIYKWTSPFHLLVERDCIISAMMAAMAMMEATKWPIKAEFALSEPTNVFNIAESDVQQVKFHLYHSTITERQKSPLKPQIRAKPEQLLLDVKSLAWPDSSCSLPTIIFLQRNCVLRQSKYILQLVRQIMPLRFEN